MNLTQLEDGQTAKILNIVGGITFKKKIMNMGIHIDSVITKISTQTLGGPITIKLNNSKVALGQGLAKKIRVKILGDIKNGRNINEKN